MNDAIFIWFCFPKSIICNPKNLINQIISREKLFPGKKKKNLNNFDENISTKLNEKKKKKKKKIISIEKAFP